MKKFLISICEYSKSLFQEWYLFLGLIPSLLGTASVYLPDEYHFTIPLQYTVVYALGALLFASYRVWLKTKRQIKAPKVIIDYDLSVFNICYLEIKNVGSDYARDIQTTFEPNIETLNKKPINDENFCKNLSQLAPGQKIRFLFGTFTDQKILQEFRIRISYFDLGRKEKYTTDQVIDPSSFIDTSPQERENEIVRELKNISAGVKKISDHTGKIPDTLKTGISVRNSDLKDFSEEELFAILKNIHQYGNDEDFWLNPFFYDARQVILYLRNKILAKPELSKKDKALLDKLNDLHKYQPHIGSGNTFKTQFGKLFE